MFLLKYFSRSTTVLLAIICINSKVTQAQAAGEQHSVSIINEYVTLFGLGSYPFLTDEILGAMSLWARYAMTNDS
jgi:hypothetical protein